MPWAPVTYAGVAAGVLAFLLAAAVVRTSRSRTNRWLAGLLIAEGTLQTMAALQEVYAHPVVEVPFVLCLVLAPALSLVVVSTLDTPLVAGLQRPRGRAITFGVSAAFLLLIGGFMVAESAFAADLEENIVSTVTWLALFAYLAAVYIFSFVASLSALRRATPGTLARSRAKAFAIAFGTRDIGLGTFFIVVVALEGLGRETPWNEDWVPALTGIAYLLLLAYGILRTQLFDIDLKIKVGISKSTVVTLGLVAVLAAAKVAEFYLSRTFGFVAGGIAAGIMLVLAPRLNKIGDKVANAALPQASGSAEYIANRKLEVYRAAVETAWEDGNLSHGDRAILDRLREKLEISGPEAYEVETDVARSLRAPARAPTAAPS